MAKITNAECVGQYTYGKHYPDLVLTLDNGQTVIQSLKATQALKTFLVSHGLLNKSGMCPNSEKDFIGKEFDITTTPKTA